MSDHIAELAGLPVERITTVSDDSWQRFLTKADQANVRQEALSIAVKIYCASGAFNTANAAFARFIRPHALEFDAARMVELLQGIESNNQTYWRGRARIDHPLIKDRSDELEIDLTLYPNFRESLPQ